MADGLLFPMAVEESSPARRWPKWVKVHRRGPILRPSRSAPPEAGVFGVDLTAGCALGCPFCHIRALPSYPGEDQVQFDPSVSRRLGWTLEPMEVMPKLVVLSPSSDPFPPQREVRLESERVIRLVLDRGIELLIMTRGRIPLKLIGLLAEHSARVRVALALTTLDRALCRTLEPRAAPPTARVARIARLVAAGVPVEVRLEPLISGLTDTRENIRPLFEALAGAGVSRVVAHYLFLHPALKSTLKGALHPLGLSEKLEEDYQAGPVFPIGSLGPTKHLPLDVRRAGLASLSAWGAEFGLSVETGAAQNPDLPRAELFAAPVPSSRPSLRPGVREPRPHAQPGSNGPTEIKAGP
jgi:DNA repair photolyase